MPCVILVSGYIPAYVLYLDGLRRGITSKSRQLQLLLGNARKVLHTRIIQT
jgi:hypothetical protein